MVDGDFVIGNSESQHIQLIAHVSKGEFKRNPEVGANLTNLIHDENPKRHALEFKRQLEYDGAKVTDVVITDGVIRIDANYPTNG